MLEKYKANPNINDNNGKTPLQFASENYYNDVVDYLKNDFNI